MKKLLKVTISQLVLSSYLVVLGCPYLFAAVKATALETQNEKESYSIGYQIGMSMKADGVEVDFDRLIEGLQDAIGSKDPRLSMGEMRTLIVSLKKKSRDAQMRRIQEQIVKNAQESEKFLEGNKKKEGVKSTESGLQYKVLKEGAGAAPTPEDFVKVNYRGTFIDGKEFDSSYAKGEPIRVQVDGVIKGWTEALPMMTVGSKWQLFVPPHLAYGRGGLGQKIPPNKVLVFDMELLAVEKSDKVEQLPQSQAAQTPTVRNLAINGEIAKSEHGYIIRSMRGNVLMAIYTILNPEPKVLDAFVNRENPVPIEVRIVSGDNINIEKINGREYPGEWLTSEKVDQLKQQSQGQSAQTSSVRKMTMTGEIAKSEHGYIIRSMRGNVPIEIFTILNPNPNILDEFIKNGKIVPIEVRIVSGDNINIEKINGREYPSATP